MIVEQIANVMGIKAVRLSKMSGWNLCSTNNGNCSHICLYRHDKTRVCACQAEYELAKDGLSCIVPEAFLLYAKKDSIGRISIENVNNNNQMTIPITGSKHPR